MAEAIGFSTGWEMSQRRILISLAIALAVSSCNRKAEGQTVAVVNDQEITAAELNAELANNPNVANAADPKQARAAVLQRLIDRKLLVQQAQKDGIDKSPEFLNQQRRLNDELMLNMLLTRQLNTSQVPSADEITRYEAGRPEMFANRETWTLSQVIYPLPKDKGVNTRLAGSKTLAEVEQILTSSGIQFKRDTKKIDTAVFPHTIYAQIAKLKPGEPFIAPGPGQAVASVITSREANLLTSDQARTVALNAMKREQAAKLVQDRLKGLRGSAKIHYQPGYEPPKN
jgi:EpsD family peptidyl-prolyl cis-trans isomerase